MNVIYEQYKCPTTRTVKCDDEIVFNQYVKHFYFPITRPNGDTRRRKIRLRKKLQKKDMVEFKKMYLPTIKTMSRQIMDYIEGEFIRQAKCRDYCLFY